MNDETEAPTAIEADKEAALDRLAKMTPLIELGVNNAQTNDSCAFCGRRTDPIGFDPMVGWSLVYDGCWHSQMAATRKCPGLSAALHDLANEIEEDGLDSVQPYVLGSIGARLQEITHRLLRESDLLKSERP